MGAGRTFGTSGAWLAMVALGCAADVRDESPFMASGASATDDSADDDDDDDDDSAGVTSTGGGADDDDADSGGVKLDVAGGQDSADDGMSEAGCEKADFLFVVDNSGSMEDEQMNLVASFGGFINTIQDTLMAQDYHIMVVDTDAESLSFSSITCNQDGCSCEPVPQCCLAICSNNGPIQINPPPTECGGQSCDEFELPTGCPVVLGAGKAEDPLGNDCGIDGGNRWMTDGQNDLVGTFECAALVGAGGDGNERPMQAMVNALTAETAMGGCNEGFLRDDAILVVTFITDEEDGGSMGTPDGWHQALVAAKNGNEEAVVVLGLLGDSGVPGGTCADGQADDAPQLRQFAESFTHGQWGSVCAPSYNAFFEQAVSVIDVSCDDFVPEG